MSSDYYQILGLNQTATSQDIKKAYRRLSKRYHPDLHPQSDKAYYEAKFKEVQAAYATLSDAGKRAFYDWGLSTTQYEASQENTQHYNKEATYQSYYQQYSQQYQQASDSTPPESASYGIRPMLIILAIVFGISFLANGWIDNLRKKMIIEQYDDLDKPVEKSPFVKIMDFVEDYDYVNFFKEERAYVLKNDKYGFIDEEGKAITPIKYDWVTNFRDGFAIVQIGQKFGYINRAGEEVTPVHYDWVEHFYEAMGLVQRSGYYAFVDTTGKKLFDVPYDAVGRFNDGLAAFSQYNGWGYINRRGETIIPAVYDKAYPFREGLAAVQYRGKWGYINTSGQVVISFYFQTASSFGNGLANVVLPNGEEAIIDRKGNIVGQKE